MIVLGCALLVVDDDVVLMVVDHDHIFGLVCWWFGIFLDMLAY